MGRLSPCGQWGPAAASCGCWVGCGCERRRRSHHVFSKRRNRSATMEDHTVADLQREWRQIVLAKLDALERGQKHIESEILAIRINTVSNGDYNVLEGRVAALEQAKTKALAVIATIQAIGVAFLWVIDWFRKA